MKKSTYILLACITSLLVISSCGDDEEVAAISNEEAATLMLSSVSSSTGGLLSLGTLVTGIDQAENPGGRINNCGVTIEIDTAITQSSQGFTISLDYDFELFYNCVNGLPQSMLLDATYLSSFDGPDFAFNFDYDVNWNVTGVNSFVAPLVFSGSSTLNSQTTDKSNGTQTSFNSNIQTQALTFSRQTLNYTGGTLTISISGTGPDGSFSTSGVLTITGSNSGTLVVNGQSFNVNVFTGEILG